MDLSGIDTTTTSLLARDQGIKLPTVPTGATPAADAAGNFQDTLKQTQSQEQKVRKTAGDLVATALILPVLKQIRRSPFARKNIFSGGIGENTFGPEFDMQIADRIAHSPKMAATDALARRLMQHGHARSPIQSEAPRGQPGVDVHG